MTDIPEHTFECGPTNFTVSQYNETVSEAIYACGKEQERYTRSNGAYSGKSGPINLKVLIMLIVVTMIREVCAIGDIDQYGLQMVDSPNVEGNVYNVT